MTEFELKIKKLLDEGLDLIPTNSKREPYKPWLTGNPPKMEGLELFDLIFKKKSCHVALRLGSFNNGLLCIDVDSKHKFGFSEIVLQELKELDEDQFKKFRIDRTPSGGLHIYYRVSLIGAPISEYPRGDNLAIRLATETELLVKKDKQYCFLELKAQDNLSHCYPSEGYSRIQDGENGESWENRGGINGGGSITTISWEKHSELIDFLKVYNELEIVKTENDITQNKIKFYNSDVYVPGETPFQQFNKSPDAWNVLENCGWKFVRKSGGNKHIYARPNKDSKYKETNAVFRTDKNMYIIYTPHSDIPQGGYLPSSLLCHTKFDKSGQKCYEWLVNEGYGTLLPNVEKNNIKKAIRSKREPQKNISEKGKIFYEEEKKKYEDNYGHGIFWKEKIDESGVYTISREDLYLCANSMGYYKHKDEPVLIEDYKIKKITPDDFYNGLKKYIEKEPVGVKNAYEAFLQNSGKFTISRLEKLDKDILVKSNKSISYKFYHNCYIRIDKDGYKCLDYEGLEKFVFEEDIKNRDFHKIDFELCKLGLYYTFIINCVSDCENDGKKDISDYIKKCIGYYAHDYRDEEGYLIIATEKCEDFRDGGGSGKNIFWALFKLITTLKSTAASMIKKDNQLLQSWNFEKIFILSDLPRDFDLIFFKDIITDGAVVRKLYKDEFNVAVDEMAKIGASSNYSFDNADPGIKRRVRAIEFSDYYTLRGGVRKAHGNKMFPKDWDEMDYLLFDNIMMVCIQEYLKDDGEIERRELSDGGWKKQFDQKYHHLYEFISLNIESFKNSQYRASDFAQIYNSYCADNNIRLKVGPTKMNDALDEYCKHYKIGFDKNASCRDSVGTFTGKKFFTLNDTSIENVIEDEAVFGEDDIPF